VLAEVLNVKPTGPVLTWKSARLLQSVYTLWREPSEKEWSCWWSTLLQVLTTCVVLQTLTMFGILQEAAAAPERFHSTSKVFNGVPQPPPNYVPPTGASAMTWPNIYRNLKRIDYCTEQFNHIRFVLDTRMHQIDTGRKCSPYTKYTLLI